MFKRFESTFTAITFAIFPRDEITEVINDSIHQFAFNRVINMRIG